MYSVIDPLMSGPATVERIGERLVFDLPVYDDWQDRFTVSWTVDDEQVSDQPTLELGPAELPKSSGWIPVTASVRDATDKILVNDPTMMSEVRWFVRSR